MSRFFSFGGFFSDSKESDINEDINKMVIYIQKNYSPADRIRLLEGVKTGIKNGLELESKIAREKQERADGALELITE